MPTLSIIVPIYNEEKTLAALVDKLVELKLPLSYDKEILLCSDASTDSSQKIIDEKCQQFDYIKALSSSINIGKTQTVKAGILASRGDFVIIQDADLEYDPGDIGFMLSEGLKRNCDVVYGNRFGQYNGVIYWQNFLGNLLLSIFSNIFTIKRIRVFIPDMEVCYKLIKGSVAREIAEKIKSKSNFGFEPEITALLGKYCKNVDHLSFLILPISYWPRSVAEGKKIRALQDGSRAFLEIIMYNLFF